MAFFSRSSSEPRRRSRRRPAVEEPLPADHTPTPSSQLAAMGYYAWQKLRLKQSRRSGDEPTLLAFTGYGSTSWIRVFSRVLSANDDAFIGGRRLSKVVTDGVRGWRNFVSPPIAYAKVTIEVQGKTHTVRADRNGVIDAVVPAELEPGWATAILHIAGGESTEVDLFIVSDDTTEAVISDIDDTVVVTALPRPLLAAWNSFVLDEHARTPTPGMPVLLNRMVESYGNKPVFYVSTGAWNVAQTLTRFLGRNLYPFGPMLLTSWGPTRNRAFRSGTEHKVSALKRLASDFPNITWTLVGDDGQHDPEIYTHFALSHPGRVKVIVIRQLTPSQALLAGGRADETRYRTPGVPWVYGPDGASIGVQLERLGILEPTLNQNSVQGWPESMKRLEAESLADQRPQTYPIERGDD